jgi:hypothetical protein
VRISGPLSQQEERREEPEPDHVDEVPVEADRLDRGVVPRGELAVDPSQQHDAHADHAAQDVRAVEPCHGVEEGAIDAAADSEPEGRVVVELAGKEDHAQDDGDGHRADHSGPIALADPRHGVLHRERAGDEDRGQDGRQGEVELEPGGGPDGVLGPDADPAVRNILGVVDKVGLAIGGEVIKHRGIAQDIQVMIAGRSTHLVWTLPGGVSKGITEEERAQIEELAKSCVEFSKFTLQLFDDVVLKNKAYVDLILSDTYQLKTYYMGLVDSNDKVNFYDGKIKVVDPEGKEEAKYMPSEYLDYITERVEPWSYLKFPYLKKIGWKGLVDGKESGVYRAAPAARLNAASGMATPLAQEAYEKYVSTLGGKPVHATLANHWSCPPSR